MYAGMTNTHTHKKKQSFYMYIQISMPRDVMFQNMSTITVALTFSYRSNVHTLTLPSSAVVTRISSSVDEEDS